MVTAYWKTCFGYLGGTGNYQALSPFRDDSFIFIPYQINILNDVWDWQVSWDSVFWESLYTPGIYAEGYIVFAFPFVCSFVRLWLPSSTWNLQQSFACKFLKWGISHEPLIRKHSYLDHRYPGGSAFIPWLLTPGSMPQCGARGQNLGHL